MAQTFAAGTRRMPDGSFLPFVDIVDADRGTEWQQPHPQGCVGSEALAELLSLQLAQSLRAGEPVHSPAERYRQSQDARAATTAPAAALSRFAERLDRHQSLLSGAERRRTLAGVA